MITHHTRYFITRFDRAIDLLNILLGHACNLKYYYVTIIFCLTIHIFYIFLPFLLGSL
ncbi:hypothetical protein KsCSTR_15200 [Candidatus Kuenenia stuttgartiensis]|uniref:Uncharacterized protein n=1 Tax=Kuenenia stuttgartiensis TaxID=174633 RepID=Q1Q1I8_KUEST|nr:hypothetical protein KsCSTR_15200 [Candidatus Kuenenia stuttgartiensis]CAJ73873.1 unknown protein [Candidatus Kuenenia stuttgartiensis]